MSHNASAYPDTDNAHDSEDDCYEDLTGTFKQNRMDLAIAVEGNKMLIKRKLISKDDLSYFILSGVKLTSQILGQGSYGTVYKAEHNGTACAAKRVNLYRDLVKSHHTDRLSERMAQNFLLECLQHSKLCHPNVVRTLGVFYDNDQTILPVLVMELMQYNLTQLLRKSHNIIMYVKLSILQDVSRGLCYLHTQNPPIVHQALYSDNILFTEGLTAKIGDFKTGSETVSDQALLSVRRNRGSNDFLPDSHDNLTYEPPLNVFSFGCVICHVITQKWPVTQCQTPVVLVGSTGPIRSYSARPGSSVKKTYQNHVYMFEGNTTDDWCVEKHQNYIDQISDDSLKQLVEACLQRNSKNRPHMSLIYERITRIMEGELGFHYISAC